MLRAPHCDQDNGMVKQAQTRPDLSHRRPTPHGLASLYRLRRTEKHIRETADLGGRAIDLQTVDNDIQCDGTADANYKPFRDTLLRALRRIATQAPQATILVVSSPWATVENYVAVIPKIPGGKERFTGTGPCDLFDGAGRPRPAQMKYQQKVIDDYLAQVATACRQVQTCHYDDGALAHMPIVAADLIPDFNHLSIAGQAKQAALEWKTLAPLVSRG
jgi:hypothetical protein